MRRVLSVACPNCRAEVEWTEASSWRPFCSARCKGIDLGDWASERFVVAGDGLVDGTGVAGPAAVDLAQ